MTTKHTEFLLEIPPVCLICRTSEHPHPRAAPSWNPWLPSPPPGVPQGLTDAAFAILMQLVVVPALAAVLGQGHLHTLVLTATVVQGTRVQS